MYCTKSRRAERYWQKTLLQMEEMESQIREEIRKGVFIRTSHTHTSAPVQTLLSKSLRPAILKKKKRSLHEDRNVDHTCLCLLVCVYLCLCARASRKVYLFLRFSSLKCEKDTTVDRSVPSKRDS